MRPNCLVLPFKLQLIRFSISVRLATTSGKSFMAGFRIGWKPNFEAIEAHEWSKSLFGTYAYRANRLTMSRATKPLMTDTVSADADRVSDYPGKRLRW